MGSHHVQGSLNGKKNNTKQHDEMRLCKCQTKWLNNMNLETRFGWECGSD